MFPYIQVREYRSIFTTNVSAGQTGARRPFCDARPSISVGHNNFQRVLEGFCGRNFANGVGGTGARPGMAFPLRIYRSRCASPDQRPSQPPSTARIAPET